MAFVRWFIDVVLDVLSRFCLYYSGNTLRVEGVWRSFSFCKYSMFACQTKSTGHFLRTAGLAIEMSSTHGSR